MKTRIKNHDNWGTPKDIYDKLDQEFHFDFDPCPMFYKFDGLTCKWGKSNFINPPYSRGLKEAFIRKAWDETQKGNLCVLLLPVSTSTKIFHEIIYPNAEIRLLKGRIKFLPEGKPCNKAGQMDSMVVILRGRDKELEGEKINTNKTLKSFELKQKEEVKLK